MVTLGSTNVSFQCHPCSNSNRTSPADGKGEAALHREMFNTKTDYNHLSKRTRTLPRTRALMAPGCCASSSVVSRPLVPWLSPWSESLQGTPGRALQSSPGAALIGNITFKPSQCGGEGRVCDVLLTTGAGHRAGVRVLRVLWAWFCACHSLRAPQSLCRPGSALHHRPFLMGSEAGVKNSTG